VENALISGHRRVEKSAELVTAAVGPASWNLTERALLRGLYEGRAREEQGSTPRGIGRLHIDRPDVTSVVEEN